jgi:hypothetical protein
LVISRCVRSEISFNSVASGLNKQQLWQSRVTELDLFLFAL